MQTLFVVAVVCAVGLAVSFAASMAISFFLHAGLGDTEEGSKDVLVR